MFDCDVGKVFFVSGFFFYYYFTDKQLKTKYAMNKHPNPNVHLHNGAFFFSEYSETNKNRNTVQVVFYNCKRFLKMSCL